MRLRVRHLADGHDDTFLQARNPKAGAKMFAHRNYVARGERIDVIMEADHDLLHFEVTRSRIDEGGCRVIYVGKNS